MPPPSSSDSTQAVARRGRAREHRRPFTTWWSARSARATRGRSWARPPDWYKSLPYRSRAVSDPRGVLAEFGVGLDGDVELRVVDSTADVVDLVIPRRPAGTGALTEDELAAIVTRDSMIGVAEPLAPTQVAA